MGRAGCQIRITFKKCPAGIEPSNYRIKHNLPCKARFFACTGEPACMDLTSAFPDIKCLTSLL